MKMRFLKCLLVFALVAFVPMGRTVVHAEEALIPEKMDPSTRLRDTDYYSYTYTETDKITIGGTEYTGIVIPIEQDYAGGLDIFVDGYENVTTSSGEVYCALFDDMNFSLDAFKATKYEMLSLYKSYGDTGTRYLVIYTDAYTGSSVTTSIQFQMGLYYGDSYEMKENVVYKNYAEDSETGNCPYIKITTPGYYIFESDQAVSLSMNLSGDYSVIPADNIAICWKTDYKIMLHLREEATYDLEITSTKGIPYSFTYYYCPPEMLELTKTNTVPVYIADDISLVAIKYTPDKTGVVTLAGISDGWGEAEISQSKIGGSIMYRRKISTSAEVTEASTLSFFVRKGVQYSFLVYATDRTGYVNASFKIVDFVEADVLGKPTQEEAYSSKAQLKYGKKYYGSFDWDESNSSWLYFDKPCVVRFTSYKMKENEGYNIHFYDGDSEVLTSYVVNDNKDIRFIVLENWVPGYLEIVDIAGAGYYTITVEELVPDVGDILKGPDATYKVTTSPYQDTKTGGVVCYMKAAKKKAETVVVPSTVTIKGITYKVCSIDPSAFAGNKYITSVTVGNHVKKIGAKTFKGCVNLKTIKLGTKVKTIGNEAFAGCGKLSSVTIGKNVTTIGDKAFYKCSALKKLIIPAKVSKIGSSAFRDCKRLKSITIKTTKLTAKKVGKNAFKGVGSDYYKKVVVKVPAKKLKSYRQILKKAGLSSEAKVTK